MLAECGWQSQQPARVAVMRSSGCGTLVFSTQVQRCRREPVWLIGAVLSFATFCLLTAVPCIALETGLDSSSSVREGVLLSETEVMLQELHSLRSELVEKNQIIVSLSGALKGLREDIHRCEQRCASPQKAENDRAQELVHTKTARHRSEQDEQTEWVYGVPSGRKIVIELGANNGEWIAQFLDEHAGFFPVIIEPQPQFSESLRGLAKEYGGMFVQGAAWVTEGEQMLFHAHSDQRGVGSSLFNDAVYANGHCWGMLECPVRLDETYAVTTIDVAALIARVALPDDYIVLRMDIEGAEYEVSRWLLASGVACWLDEWEVEVHAMYAPQNHKFRPLDSVLPWILRACNVNMTVFQLYKFDEKLQQLRALAEAEDACAGTRYENDEGCSEDGWCTGIPE